MDDLDVADRYAGRRDHGEGQGGVITLTTAAERLDRRLVVLAAAVAEAHAYGNQVLAEELEVRYGGLLAERLRLAPVD